MFRDVYEFCMAVFLLQGALLLLMLVLSGVAWFRQMARLAAIGQALGRDRKRHARTLASMIAALPRLQPLNCAACGAAVALDAASTVCINCRTVSAPPPDYAATVSLRRGLERLSRLALRHWYVARILTAAPVRIFFVLMIFAEPLLFMVCVIGAVEFHDTWLDRAFESTGETWAFVIMLLAFGGFILWIVIFVILANLSKDLRRKLPVFPVFVRSGDGSTEFANCQSCGGGIHYGTRAFAALCGYCGVENFRARHSRNERAGAEAQRVSTRASLFGAMEIIEGFTGVFFMTMAILAGGFLLLALIIALDGN